MATFLENERVRLLWHPSLSLESPRELLNIVDSILRGREELTLLCVEGSIIHGPNGTGMFDSFHGKAKKDLIAALCSRAEYVLDTTEGLVRAAKSRGLQILTLGELLGIRRREAA